MRSFFHNMGECDYRICDKTQKSLPDDSERLLLLVGVAGFEPTTPCSQSVIRRFLQIFADFYFVL